MSRIGKQPIEIPSGVSVGIKEANITVRGSKGELTDQLNPLAKVEVKDNEIIVNAANETKDARAVHGLQRSLIANMVHGVHEGFEKVLEMHGVGFKASIQGNILKLSVGFSHDVDFVIPDEVKIAVDGTTITVTGINKQQVGQTAANIRKIKKPEPYKGKGIRYKDEYIIRKAGKTTAGGAA